MTGRTFHPGSVVWGLIFILLGLLFLLDQLDVIDLRAAYILPIVLIVIGVAVLIGGGTARRSRS
jgi:hypothetical protein